MADNGNPIFAAVRWLAIAKLSTQLLSWFGTYYIATVLLPSDYGLSAMATAFTNFAQIFAEMGIGITIIQRQSIDKKEIETLFTFSLILGAVCAVAAYFLSFAGGWYFKRVDIIPLTQMTALIFLGNALSIVPYNILNRDMRFRERGYVDIWSTLVSMICMVLMAHAGLGAWALVGGALIRAVTRTGFSFYFSKFVPSLGLKWQLLKRDLAFSLPVTFNGLLFIIQGRSIPLILGKFHSAAELGYYTLASTLAEIPNQKVVQIVREMLLPLLARKEEKDRLESLFVAMKLCTLFITPVYLAGFLYGADVLNACFPDKWASMSPIFAGLCLVQISIVLSSIVMIFVTASGQPVKSTYQEFALAILIPLSTFLFRDYSMTALAHVWTVVWAAVTFTWIFLLFRKSGAFLIKLSGLNLQVLGVGLGAFALASVLSRFAQLDGYRWSVFARAGFFLAVYAGFLAAFHRAFLVKIRRK